MSASPPNPAYRNARAERWREVARCLRVALGECVRLLRAAGVDAPEGVREALVRGHLAFREPECPLCGRPRGPELKDSLKEE